MRKLFFITILFLFNTSLVKAEVFYSPYSDYSEYSEQIISASDTVSVKKERRYKWYKESKILGEYHPINSIVENYPEIDENDFYEMEFSDWSTANPGFNFYRVIESRKVFEYKDPLPIKYIHFYDLKGGNGYLNISELEIFNNDEKINYTVLNMDNDFKNKINDGNYYDDNNRIINNSKIAINLNGEYNIKNLKIKIYLYDETTEQKDIKAKFTYDQNFNSYALASLYLIHLFTHNNVSEIEPFIYKYEDCRIFKALYGEASYSVNYPEEKEGRIIKSVTQYRYKDTLFRYYRIDRDYLVDYYKDNPNDYIKDSSKYKDYYCYKKRDKIVISDDLTFTDYDRKLKDLILKTTNDDIKIESNFNIKKNGQYKVKIILPFMVITKTVKVDILENTINEVNDKLLQIEKEEKKIQEQLEKKSEELIDLKKELKNLENGDADLNTINEYKDKILILDEHIKYLINKINQLDQERIKYNKKLKELLNKKQEKNIVNKKENNKENYILVEKLKNWLWLIIVILFSLLLFKIIRTKKLSY